MKNVDWKDVAIRSIKTFIETVISFVLAHMGGVDIFGTDKGVWLSVIISAGAAGIAAVYNGVIRPMLKLPEK